MIKINNKEYEVIAYKILDIDIKGYKNLTLLISLSFFGLNSSLMLVLLVGTTG